jgi:hypothetical protein
LTSKLLELDKRQIDDIITLVNNELEILNIKISEAVKDSMCSYETMKDLCSRRNGLSTLVVILKENI